MAIESTLGIPIRPARDGFSNNLRIVREEHRRSEFLSLLDRIAERGEN